MGLTDMDMIPQIKPHIRCTGTSWQCFSPTCSARGPTFEYAYRRWIELINLDMRIGYPRNGHGYAPHKVGFLDEPRVG